MGMRRTQQRQLGARRGACAGAEASPPRQIIAELVSAHADSIAFVRKLMLNNELADKTQAEADHIAALAAANPADGRSNERASAAAARAEAAHLAKQNAIDGWASHVMRLHGLVAMTDALYCNPVLHARGARLGRPE